MTEVRAVRRPEANSIDIYILQHQGSSIMRITGEQVRWESAPEGQEVYPTLRLSEEIGRALLAALENVVGGRDAGAEYLRGVYEAQGRHLDDLRGITERLLSAAVLRSNPVPTHDNINYPSEFGPREQTHAREELRRAIALTQQEYTGPPRRASGSGVTLGAEAEHSPVRRILEV